MKHLSIFLIILMTGANAALQGQPLEELLQYASENNPQLRAIQHEYQAMLEIPPQMSQLPDPVVSTGIFVRAAETRVGPQVARIGATQMLPWKGTLDARADVAIARAGTRLEQLANYERELHLRIRQAYYRYYEITRTQQVIRRSLRIYDALDAFALARLESGRGSAADVLRIQLKRQELEQEIALLENQKAKPLATINQSLFRPVDTPVSVDDSLSMTSIQINLDTLGQFLQKQHPAIAYYTKQQAVAQSELALNALNRKPSFTVGLDYIFVNQRPDVDIPQNGKDIIVPMASVRIPLNTKQYDAKDRQEQIAIEALEQQKMNLESQIIAEIRSALADIEDAHLKLQLYDQLIATTKATIRVLESEYTTSGRGFDELLRLQNELVTYDLKTLKTIVQSHQAAAIIERHLSTIN